MSTFLGSFLSFVLLYKYSALFGITFLAALALPLPASTMLAAAGAFAFEGYLNFFLVVLIGFAGNVCGDVVGYLFARRYGEQILQRFGFRRLVRSRRYQQLREYINDFPHALIFFTRFLAEAGPIVNVLAGIAQLPPRTFFFFDVLGELSYVLLYVLIGYALGTQWEDNIGFLVKIVLVIVPLGILITLVQFVAYRRRQKKKYPSPFRD